MPRDEKPATRLGAKAPDLQDFDTRGQGTDELERGMKPGRAADVARIGLIAVALLLIFNAGGLARWTQNLPSSAGNAWIAEMAGEWNAAMQKLGPAAWFDAIRDRVRSD